MKKAASKAKQARKKASHRGPVAAAKIAAVPAAREAGPGAGSAALVLSSVLVRAWAVRRRAA